jgi:plasmid stability protein
MDTSKRATVYFAPEVHKALRLRAAATDQSLSQMVNEAVRMVLAEDAADLEAFSTRKGEKSVSFESFLSGLKRRGRI